MFNLLVTPKCIESIYFGNLITERKVDLWEELEGYVWLIESYWHVMDMRFCNNTTKSKAHSHILPNGPARSRKKTSKGFGAADFYIFQAIFSPNRELKMTSQTKHDKLQMKENIQTRHLVFIASGD